MSKFIVINGPNLNLLGTREPGIYGTTTFDQLEEHLRAWGRDNGHLVTCFQSNAEQDIINAIHQSAAFGEHPQDGIIINAGALSHTSLAIADALSGVDVPYLEVHLSNIHARESFRHFSYLSHKALGVIVGLGVRGYEYALQYLDGLTGADGEKDTIE